VCYSVFANCEYNGKVTLRPQDVVLLLKLSVVIGKRPTYSSLGADLRMSASEVHAAMKRAESARLLTIGARGLQPDRRALLEFVLHGLRYAFPAIRGALTRGVPTSYAAPPLNSQFVQPNELPPVWPSASGKVRGYELSPLYPKAPDAALKDAKLYELLALVDALRDGRARERQIAEKLLTARLVDRHAEP
jgi:hypothetical protein